MAPHIAVPMGLWLVVAGFALLMLLGFCLLMWKTAKPTDAKKAARVAEEQRQRDSDEEGEEAVGERRRGGDVMRRRLRRVAEEDGGLPGPQAVVERRHEEGDEENNGEQLGDDEGDADVDADPRKKGKKYQEKQRMKEEKRAAREADLAARKAKKERDEAEMEKRHGKKEQDAAERLRLEQQLQQEEAARTAALEKARKDEYDKWRSAIVIEREGSVSKDVEDMESRMDELVAHVKERKVVLLEDLAAEFGLKTKDVIDKLKKLESDQKISGVIDDRGKFIYIKPEELDAVARFIKKKGRVSIEQIAAESNKLINLSEAKSA